MEHIKLLRRLVRNHLTDGYERPFPIETIVYIAKQVRDTPFIVDFMVKIETEYKRKLTWMPWEIQYLLTHWRRPDKQLAEELGRSEESVRGKRIALKLCRQQGTLKSKGRIHD